MKLLKYVMTSDAGLAPNPYFGICSLALCTPNHMNARLCVGDWIVGHSCRATGNKLIYAMRVTKVLTLPEYFSAFPEKRPNPYGDARQRCGDNFYDNTSGKWRRLPSACHNEVDSFVQDIGRPVFLAEGDENFWYFGGLADPATLNFANTFPELIKDRQGISYIYDEAVIDNFVTWLKARGRFGLIGTPRDPVDFLPDLFLVEIEPVPSWISLGSGSHPNGDRDGRYTCRPRPKSINHPVTAIVATKPKLCR
jgi:hypothetical protein